MKDKIIAKGVAAGGGIAIGHIRLITSVRDLERVKEGDILVVKSSNPAWSKGMLVSCALIVENGGIISHVAIIAREMGIPCIVGVKNAMLVLKNDQKVRVDGNEGTVYES